MATTNCVICNATNAKLCSTCHSISYCSPKCQKEDWRLHKTICKALATLSPRPSDSHKLSILLPFDAEDPQLIWINCEHRFDDENERSTYEVPDTQHLLSAGNLDPKYGNTREFKKIRRNVLRGYNLDYTVEVICREAFLLDGSTSNVCVRNLTKGRMTHDWRGPIVVMRQPGVAMDPSFYGDVTAAELRIAVDHFLSY